MQAWSQIYTPLGSLWLSALVAAIPIIFFFAALAILRIKGHVAGGITLALALLVAIFSVSLKLRSVSNSSRSFLQEFYWGAPTVLVSRTGPRPHQ